MSAKKATSKRSKPIVGEQAAITVISDELAEYLTLVAKQMKPIFGGKAEQYDGFCFIARDGKTNKIRAHLVMNVPNERLSTTFTGSDMEDLEQFVHAWANHSYITKMASAK